MHIPDNQTLFSERDLKYLTHLTVMLEMVIFTLFARFQVRRLEAPQGRKASLLHKPPESQRRGEQHAAPYVSSSQQSAAAHRA